MRSEHWTMATIWYDPKRRARNRFAQLKGEANRIQRIGIAKNDQSSRGNGTEHRWCELHVIGCVGHRSSLFHEPIKLLLAAFASFAHRFPFWVRKRLKRELTLNRSRLVRKIWWCTDHNHCFDSVWLLCRHVQQRNPSTAESDRFYSSHPEMIKEREYIASGLPERMRSFKSGRRAIASHVGSN